MLKISVLDLMRFVGGRLLAGPPEGEITGFASLKEARRGDLSFFHDHRYESRLQKTQASAVLVEEQLGSFPANVACIGVSDPSRSFEKIVEAYGVQPQPFVPGVHPSAVVAASATLD